MFDGHRAKKDARDYAEHLAQWQQQRDAYAHLIDLAEHYAGAPAPGFATKAGEAVFATVTGASLVEERRGPGHWEGHSQGISVPVGSIGGHSVRYRVGATRGHYVQGTPAPAAVDTGTIYVTNQRIVFVGARETRECLFDKLVAFQHDDSSGTTVLSVSNRQKPTTLHYGPQIAGWFDFRVDLALAHYRNQVPQLVGKLQAELAAIEADKPAQPVDVGGGHAPTG